MLPAAGRLLPAEQGAPAARTCQLCRHAACARLRLQLSLVDGAIDAAVVQDNRGNQHPAVERPAAFELGMQRQAGQINQAAHGPDADRIVNAHEAIAKPDFVRGAQTKHSLNLRDSSRTET
ncbi:hypothetical protein DF3PA_110088 [Candidatus Defluviicoccus seviourii]|uniref:Uncharacterized protein n=1 Tax=Candidatus Defluviicoccus seviourii TaxID=2565273 RepID=A0A564WCX5_9PROT|nr:hypothetical protein DF3PA_110088 [Candidatus Defluviicoccus seviourii]